VDCTLLLDGWQADSAFTVGVGTISPEAQKLIDVTEECFWKGVRQCIVGNRLGDVGNAVEKHAVKNGFSVIRQVEQEGGTILAARKSLL
jgi:methionyl aminopeptidase